MKVHPDVCGNYDVGETYLAEIDLDYVLKCAGRDVVYKSLSRFPAVTRDLAMLVDDGVKAADIENVIRRAAGNLLEELELFDIYKGSQIPEGKKSVAYSATFRGDKTLKEEDVTKIWNKVLKSLEHNLGAALR